MISNSKMRVALYARVSSEQQAEAGTIVSQIEALQERMSADGLVVEQELEFVDDGYSGTTLIRPAMERLRDAAASGCIDRLYVHSPDRLARKYAYQVLLVEELSHCGVQIEFLNHGVGENPEESLLLQVQGMVAEYERAKILERSRRGKLHAARSGSVTVVATAPYGYRYIPAGRRDGGQACYEVVWEEAKVVQQVFAWVGKERRSISWVVKSLSEQKIPTKKGNSLWSRSTIGGMLKNPAYKGSAAFGRRRTGERRPRIRAPRGRPEHPKQAFSRYAVPPEQWISIPVPAIVSEALFAAVQEQLQENRQRAREGARGARYLLQGLMVCAICGYAFYGKSLSGNAAKSRAGKCVYYRCPGTDSNRCGGQRVCTNTSVRSDILEEAVWADVCSVLSDPQRIEQEWQRRLAQQPKEEWDTSRHVGAMVEKVKTGISRLIDAYQEGLIEKAEFEPRMRSAKERLQVLEAELEQRQSVEESETALRLVIGRMRDFADKVNDGLEGADWSTRRAIMRAVVKRVEIDEEEVRVIYKIAPTAVTGTPQHANMQHCLNRADRSPVKCCGG